MFYLLNFSLGTIFAVIGVLPPGILNMTAAKTAIQRDVKTSIWFASGASVIVFFQAYVGMFLAKYLNTLPAVIETIQKAALVILSSLAIYFFYQAKRQHNNDIREEEKRGNAFSFGLFLSMLNVLAIPYHTAIATYFEVQGLIRLENPFILFYSTGASVGTFFVIWGYIRFAAVIRKRTAYIARNINYILSIFCLVLLIITLLKLI
jgi:threonine/homoserine/homoserine lactone efflux protein